MFAWPLLVFVRLDMYDSLQLVLKCRDVPAMNNFQNESMVVEKVVAVCAVYGFSPGLTLSPMQSALAEYVR